MRVCQCIHPNTAQSIRERETEIKEIQLKSLAKRVTNLSNLKEIEIRVSLQLMHI